jgi:WD40 repeat protein
MKRVYVLPTCLMLVALCGLATFLGAILLEDIFDPTPSERVCATADLTPVADSVDSIKTYAVPPADEAISLSNAHRVTEVARFERGYILSAFETDNGDKLIFTSMGMWRQTAAEPELLWTHDFEIYANFSLSPDGSRMAVYNNEQILIWNTLTKNQISALPIAFGYVKDMVFSPDSSRLAATSVRELTLWDVLKGERLFTSTDFTGSIDALAFNTSGEMLAAAGYDNPPDPAPRKFRGTVRIWNTATGKLLSTLSREDTYEMSHVGFSADATFVVADGGRENAVWKLSTGEQVFNQPMSVPTTSILLAPSSFTPDFELRSKSPQIDFSNDGKSLHARNLSANHPTNFVLYPNKDLFLQLQYGASSPSFISICDFVTRQRKALITVDEGMNTVTFNPDGKIFAVNEGRGLISLYDATTYQTLAQFNVGTTDNFVRANELALHNFVRSDGLAFSPDGKILAFAAEEYPTRKISIRLWDMSAYRELAVLSGHAGRISNLEFSPDGTHIASSSFDGTVRLWAVPTDT